MSFFAVDPVEEAIRARLKKAERLEGPGMAAQITKLGDYGREAGSAVR